jgi:hypothetical protein
LNSDNIWLDGPRNVFEHLSEFWDPERMDALLLLVPHARAFNYRGKGDFHMDPLGAISRRRTGRIAPFIFSGIQIVSHRLMRDAPDGAFSTSKLWDRAIEEGRLFGTSHLGLWYEVGEPGMIAPWFCRCIGCGIDPPVSRRPIRPCPFDAAFAEPARDPHGDRGFHPRKRAGPVVAAHGGGG